MDAAPRPGSIHGLVPDTRHLLGCLLDSNDTPLLADYEDAVLDESSLPVSIRKV